MMEEEEHRKSTATFSKPTTSTAIYHKSIKLPKNLKKGLVAS
jgi:hypothetical protein